MTSVQIRMSCRVTGADCRLPVHLRATVYSGGRGEQPQCVFCWTMYEHYSASNSRPPQVLKDHVAQGGKTNNRRGEVKAKDKISSAPEIPRIMHEGNHKGSVDSFMQREQYSSEGAITRPCNDTIYHLCRFYATAIPEQSLGRPCEYHQRC